MSMQAHQQYWQKQIQKEKKRKTLKLFPYWINFLKYHKRIVLVNDILSQLLGRESWHFINKQMAQH